MPDLITIKEVASILETSASQIYRRNREENRPIPSTHRRRGGGNRWIQLWEREAVLEFAEQEKERKAFMKKAAKMPRSKAIAAKNARYKQEIKGLPSVGFRLAMKLM